MLRRADRILLHPWTTRIGAAQALIGAASLVAGLVGGAVTLVFGFPLGWALLTAFGALNLAMSGAATLLYHVRPEPLYLVLLDHKRVLDELTAEGILDEAVAQENTVAILGTLRARREHGAAARFMKAGKDGDTNLGRLPARRQVLAELAEDFERRSSGERQRSLNREPASELGEDREVGVEPDPIQPSDAERQE